MMMYFHSILHSLARSRMMYSYVVTSTLNCIDVTCGGTGGTGRYGAVHGGWFGGCGAGAAHGGRGSGGPHHGEQDKPTVGAREWSQGEHAGGGMDWSDAGGVVMCQGVRTLPREGRWRGPGGENRWGGVDLGGGAGGVVAGWGQGGLWLPTTEACLCARAPSPGGGGAGRGSRELVGQGWGRLGWVGAGWGGALTPEAMCTIHGLFTS
jgi:hypothetical protein